MCSLRYQTKLSDAIKLNPRVTPLNAGELKVLEGTHGTDQWDSREGNGVAKKYKYKRKSLFALKVELKGRNIAVD